MTPATLSRAEQTSTLDAPSGNESSVRTDAASDPLARRLEQLAVAGRLLSLTFTAPAVPVESLLDSAGAVGLDAGDHGFVWQPPTGAAFSGLGASSLLQIEGRGRFRQLKELASSVFANLDVNCEIDGESAAPTPRFYGGFAFDVGAASGEPWHSFGDGCFTLPRWLYRRLDHTADLTLTVSGDEIRDNGGAQWALRARTLVKALKEQGVGPRAIELESMPRLHEDAQGDADWITLVSDIRQAIRNGEVEKIVAARRFTVDLPQPRSVARTLAHLAQHRRPSTGFAFCRPDASFVGLTPERLIAKSDMRLKTEALAGSIESGGEHAAELMGSGKDRLEQQLVVDAIVRRLEPLCTRLEVAARPSVRELRDVLHLHTPIVGTLNSPRHVLDLAELLHPTPAVGGVATESALEWIAAREAHPRGWYASPIGWFDAAGDGELAVALRSCLLQADRAHLYAGAGIVEDSDPERELHEVELKLQTLLQALAG